MLIPILFIFFFFNDTATTEIYTLSLHDALPISCRQRKNPYGLQRFGRCCPWRARCLRRRDWQRSLAFLDRPRRSLQTVRSEEHTSELQSQSNLVCRLLLEKKKNAHII